MKQKRAASILPVMITDVTHDDYLEKKILFKCTVERLIVFMFVIHVIKVNLY